MNRVLILIFCAAVFLCSCQKHYVRVTRLGLDRSNLASTFARTPDPRQEAPPRGEQLVVEWNLSSKVKDKKLLLDLSIIYKDYSEETLGYEIDCRRGVIAYFLIGDKYRTKKGIMMYKAEIKTKEGEAIQAWKQKLWTPLIKFDED